MYDHRTFLNKDARSLQEAGHPTYPLFVQFGQKYMFGAPGPLTSYRNLIAPLPSTVWFLVLLSIIAVLITFLMAMTVYRMFPREELVLPGVGWDDIVVKTVSTLTEPEAVPYFPKWSAGTFFLCLICKLLNG